LATATDEGKRKDAKLQIFWSIISFIVAIALGAIITQTMTLLITDVLG
jgi:hypothetical protein